MPGPGAYWIGEEEKNEIMDVLSGGYLFRYGDPSNPDFKRKVFTLEEEFAEFIGVKHAVATSSGTSSLLVSLLACGITEGDEVIVPGYTFIASISSIVYARAVPVLAEINESLTIDPGDIEKKITDRTKAIMPVHMLGNPSDMDAIMAIAEKHNLMVIEDCCQAVGASYKGKKVGSFGTMGGYSLNMFKTITSGDGGMIVTDDDDLFERAFGIHDQGHKPSRMGVEVGTRSVIGLNFRMNELTGAAALAQLRKVDKITSTLRAKKKKLKDQISDIPGVGFRTVYDPEGECATLLTILFEEKEMADRVCETLGSKTITHSGWHVYNNMEQILEHKTPVEGWSEPSKNAVPGALPQTDDILSRAMNLSVGVVDAGLGAGCGININSTDEEIEESARLFREACL